MVRRKMSSRVSTGCDVQPRTGRPKLSTQHGRVQVLLQGVVVKMNLPEAGLWFQRAASQGFPDAMHNLSHERPGRCGGFHSGCKNKTRCCKAGLPDALFALGVCFQDGRGVRKDMLCTSLGPGCSRSSFRRREALASGTLWSPQKWPRVPSQTSSSSDVLCVTFQAAHITSLPTCQDAE